METYADRNGKIRPIPQDYDICGHCDELVLIDDAALVRVSPVAGDHEWWHADCARDHSHICDGCKARYAAADLNWSDPDLHEGTALCDTCTRKEWGI